jgi:rhodanese-related sulfurtransferase
MGFLEKLLGSKESRCEKKEKKTKENMKSKPVDKKPEASYEEEPDPFIALDGEEAAIGIIAGKFQVLDVRNTHEYGSHHIPHSTLIPLKQLENRYTELDPSREILVVCERGIRSQDACWFLSEMGFKRLYHLIGGLSVYKGLQEGERFGNKSSD